MLKTIFSDTNDCDPQQGQTIYTDTMATVERYYEPKL